MRMQKKLKNSKKLLDSKLVFPTNFHTMYGSFFMFVSIIPSLHSLGVEPLLYSFDAPLKNQLQVGQLVEIPFGKNTENGIIAHIYETSPIDTLSEAFNRIKPIIKIVTTKTLLDPYQIQMITHISKQYMIPIHRVLAIFLTRPILSRLEKKNYEQIEEKNNQEEVEIGKKIISLLQDDIVRPQYLEKYLKWEPTVVILPDDFSIIPYREYFSKNKNFLFVTNDMTDTRRAQAWIDISNGIFPTICWTRKLLYYNLSRYQNIIYIEDALGPDYWHYPVRINYNDILRIFEKSNSNTNIHILTSIPTISTLTHFRHFELKNISSSSLA